MQGALGCEGGCSHNIGSPLSAAGLLRREGVACVRGSFMGAAMYFKAAGKVY